jgi:hypothetical protein
MTPLSTATRRRFLEASAGAGVTTWLASVGGVLFPGSAAAEGETSLAIVPFVGEGELLPDLEPLVMLIRSGGLGG